MKFTVVTPNLNMGHLLRETIESVLVNLKSGDEYFVVDGGSTDGSVEVIREYAGRLTGWVSEADEGYADAVAKGFSRATGDILCWVNAGDLLLRGALRAAREAFARTGADLIFGDNVTIDEEGTTLQQGRARTRNLRRIMLYGGWTPQQEACFWRRDVYERLGGLDVRLLWAADYDFFLRAACASRCAYVPIVFSAFRRHAGQKSIAGEVSYERERQACRRRMLDRLGVARMQALSRGAVYWCLVRLRHHVGGRFMQTWVVPGQPVGSLSACSAKNKMQGKRVIRRGIEWSAGRFPGWSRRWIAGGLRATLRLALRNSWTAAPLRWLLVMATRAYPPVNDLLVRACTDEKGFFRFPLGPLSNYRVPWHCDYTLGFIFAGGIVEPAAALAAEAVLRPGDEVIDVGANVGYTALHYAHLIGRLGRVIAVEPDPDLARHLEIIGEANALPQFAVRKVAASARLGTASFVRGAQSFLGRLAVAGEESRPETFKVRTVSLDALAEEERLQRVAFVKIDVEGAELDVLEGMERIIRAMAPVLLIEFHSAELEQEGLKHLAAKGYHAKVLDRAGIRSHWLFAPSEAGVAAIAWKRVKA